MATNKVRRMQGYALVSVVLLLSVISVLVMGDIRADEARPVKPLSEGEPVEGEWWEEGEGEWWEGEGEGEPVPLCEALNNCDLDWTTGGNGEWFGQTAVSYDGEASARSGAITHNQQTWLETSVPVPGEIGFWWKVSSESSFDFLEFYIDGVRQQRISGNVDWQQQSYAVGAGAVLRWRYMKDGSVNHGSDCGWVDVVTFVPDDDLLMTPLDGLSATGYEGGAFSPDSKSYLLTNAGGAPLDWTAAATSTWVAVAPGSGSLDAGAEVEVTLSLTAEVTALAPGEYSADAVITNVTSDFAHLRDVSLTVLPIPGELVVEDSIPPVDDLMMPFGPVIIDQSRTEQIVLHNTDPDNDVIVDGLMLTGAAAPSTAGTDVVTTSASSPALTGTEMPHYPDMLLVGFKDGTASAARESVHSALNAVLAHRYTRIAVDVVRLPQGSDLEAMIAAYKALPGVAYAEPNYEYQALTPGQCPPNDPRLSELWGMHKIDAPEAWCMSTGSQDVIVGVIDTGIDYNHEDLAANMWVNPSPTFGDIHGARWTNGDGSVTSGDPMDGEGHGTHCAGTVGGVGNNSVGVVGVTWNVRLMGLKFLNDSGSGSGADAISAIEYAINNGAHLTSNSWGGGGYSQALKDMIDAAGAANQLFMAAAGNNNTNNDTNPFYPATYPCENIISVASSDSSDNKSGFSCFGVNTVHLAAPGSNILSTFPGNTYGSISGTSMACPHVSGAAALLLSMNPGASYQDVKGWILDNVTPLPQWESLVITGGRLNVYEALLYSNPHFSLDNVPELPFVIAPGESVTVDVTYAPIAVGAHAAAVRINSNDADTPEITVELSGTCRYDDLSVTPEDDFCSVGLQQGPFEPECMSYTLTNTGDADLDWSVWWEELVADIEPSSGVLAPGASTEVAVCLNLAAVEALAAGDYEDHFGFWNPGSGWEDVRNLYLTVLPRYGSIVVEDSIAPIDDRDMPFGELILGDSRTEHITVTNVDATYGLPINRIGLGGGYFEDFEDGAAQGWEPTAPADWSVVSGEYRAASSSAVRMQSTYTAQLWDDCAYQATFRRTGSTDWAAVLVARATANFSWQNEMGSAYMIGLSGNGNYYVGKYVHGSFTMIQTWTASPFLNSGTAPNVVLLNLEGTSLQVYFNGNLAWSGTDSSISSEGRIGLMGYTESSSEYTNHFFDDVQVTAPLLESSGGISPLQAWYNAHPTSTDSSPDISPVGVKPPDYPGDADSALTGATAALLSTGAAFMLENLPVLPLILDPGESFTFDVVYAPETEGLHENLVVIDSSDEDEPQVEVTLSGTGLGDVLHVEPEEDFESEGAPGGPFAPVSKTYTLTNTGESSHVWSAASVDDWVSVSPDSGALAAGASTEVVVSINANAEALPPGTHADTVVFTNEDTGGSRTRNVTLNIEIPLCWALNNCDLEWTTGGNGAWFAQTAVSYDGEASAQSGTITHNQQTWLETSVPVPGEIGFWWKVSSESSYDFLEFYIDGVLQQRISGNVDWQQHSYAVDAGAVLRWRYMKDGSVDSGSDCGWVDVVTFVPDDDLLITPLEGLSATGYEGGAFSPDSKSYLLTNAGGAPLDWTAAATSTWVAVAPGSGSLDAGAEVEVTVSLTAETNTLAPGEYSADAVITNVTSDFAHLRNVSLTVLPIPGELVVEDSIPPVDDLMMPFGPVIIDQSRTEQIVLHNADPDNDVIVDGLMLTGAAAPSTAGTDVVTTSASSPALTGTEMPHYPDMLLVGFKDGTASAARESVHSALNAVLAHRYTRIAVDVVRLPQGSDLEAMIAAYKALPGVAYAEPNYEYQALTPGQCPPNDPRLSELWGMHKIDAPEAWCMSTGSQDVIVGVIDTGIDYNHEDLAANMWVNPSPTFGDIHGARWTNGDGSVTSGDPMDGEGHGTHCAGTVGGVGNNSVGVVGVAWNVRLMALKFLNDSGSGSGADAISAIEYAINNGAHLTSNSWGGGGYSQALKDMIDAAGAANQLFMAAAGNNSVNNDTSPHYPSSYASDNIIAVASSDSSDNRSGFSNWGPTTVHLAAPGSSILSTFPGNTYGSISGTSMACPHVSGAAALLLAMNPGAAYQDVKGWILDNVTPLPQWESLVITGGRLNVYEALLYSNPHFSLDNVPELPFVIAPGESVTVDVTYAPIAVGAHAAAVRINSNDADTPEITVTLSGTCGLDDLLISPEADFIAEGPEHGPFVPESITYSLTNTGSNPLDWTVAVTMPWLEVDAPAGVLAPGTSVDVTVTLNANAETLPPGTHTDTITFTNVTSSYEHMRDVTLEIGALPCMPENPIPPDGAVDVSVNTQLAWSCEATTSADADSAGVLTTLFAGGNSHNGNMFDLTAKQTVTITGWDGNMNAGGGAATVEIYYVSDHTSYVGKERNASLWTLLGSITLPSTNPSGTPTHVDIGGLTIAAGDTVGIYWTTTGVSLSYTNGPLGAFEDDALRFEDRGTGNAYPFGEVFSPRVWNGSIYYDAGSEMYDVYFGESNPPTTLVYENLSGQECDPGVLDFDTTYYWQVVAKNHYGETPGPVWSFDTALEVVEMLHPGDTNEDWRMVMSEAITYLMGWQSGANPMAYAIRAAFLWQNGERYEYDPSETPPMCWVPIASAEGELNKADKTVAKVSSESAVVSWDDSMLSLSVIPPAGTAVWGLEQVLPPGTAPLDLLGPNVMWHEDSRKLSWWNTGDAPVNIVYSLDTMPGVHLMTGAVSFDGSEMSLNSLEIVVLADEDTGSDTETLDEDTDDTQHAGEDDDPSNDNESSEEGIVTDVDEALQDEAQEAEDLDERTDTGFSCVGSKGNVLELLRKTMADWLLVGLGLTTLVAMTRLNRKP